MSSQDASVAKPVITYFDGAGDTARAVEAGRTGRPFTGLARFADGTASKLVVQMTAESRTGEIAGTILVDGMARGDGSHLYLFRGTSRRHIFSIQALATGNRTAMLSGTVTPDGMQVSGTFVASAPGSAVGGGTFEVSRA
ncbi:MAG TPA: hypothetical protein VIM11_06110 [Tepidisphaeraceae bacterium]|jgi:hypothetical protein